MVIYNCQTCVLVCIGPFVSLWVNSCLNHLTLIFGMVVELDLDKLGF